METIIVILIGWSVLNWAWTLWLSLATLRHQKRNTRFHHDRMRWLARASDYNRRNLN